MSPRVGESEQFFFRSSRYHRSNGQWYYVSRGGREHGPFVTRELAEAEVHDELERRESAIRAASADATSDSRFAVAAGRRASRRGGATST